MNKFVVGHLQTIMHVTVLMNVKDVLSKITIFMSKNVQ